MTKEQIDAIFGRAREWPLELQAEAAEILLHLEEGRRGVYRLSPEESADIDEAIAEMKRGEVASDEEVAALFHRLRQQ
jgi:citrate synthase